MSVTDPGPATVKPARRAWLTTLLKVGVSALLLAWLARSLHGVAARLDAVPPARLLPGLLVLAASTVLGAVQWIVILRHLGVRLPFRRLMSLYWIGTFFNNFMLSNVGGDAVKVVDLALADGRGGLARALAGTLLDRVLGLMALMGVALLAAGGLGGATPAGLPWWVLGVTAVPLFCIGGLLLSRRAGAIAEATLRRVGWGRAADRACRLSSELRSFRLAPGLLARLFLLSLVVQGTRVLTHVAVARAMELPLRTEQLLGLFVVVPVLGVVTTLPITFNGLGLRELTASRTMPALGIEPADAVAMQLATYFVQVVLSLVGGGLLLRRALRPRAGPPLAPQDGVEPGAGRGVSHPGASAGAGGRVRPS